MRPRVARQAAAVRTSCASRGSSPRGSGSTSSATTRARASRCLSTRPRPTATNELNGQCGILVYGSNGIQVVKLDSSSLSAVHFRFILWRTIRANGNGGASRTSHKAGWLDGRGTLPPGPRPTEDRKRGTPGFRRFPRSINHFVARRPVNAFDLSLHAGFLMVFVSFWAQQDSTCYKYEYRRGRAQRAGGQDRPGTCPHERRSRTTSTTSAAGAGERKAVAPASGAGYGVVGR